MILNQNVTERRGTRLVRVLAGVALVAAFFAPCAGAQTQPTEPKAAESKPSQEDYRTFYLANSTQPRDLSDCLTALRNGLPKAKVFPVQSQNAIVVRGSSDDLMLAQKMVSDLDRVRKVFRLTYTIRETESGKQVGLQHLALIAVPGERIDLKQGSRVPVVTGAASAATEPQTSHVQYVDVGLNIQAALDGSLNSLRLHSKVEQSSLAEEKPGASAQDPVIRQTVLEETSILVPGTPLLLGSLDLPGGTRKLEIAVLAEPVK